MSYDKAVQAIQALILRYRHITGPAPTDAEIEQVLRETMSEPKQYRPTEECRRALAESAEQHTRYWWTGQNGYPSFEERVGYFETVLNSYAEHMQAEIDHFAKQNLEWATCADKWKTQAESPLRERLTELVEFWRDKHTTGGIPFGDVAELLTSGRGVDGARAGHGTGGRGESDSTIGLPPTSPTNFESAPPKGGAAAPPQPEHDKFIAACVKLSRIETHLRNVAGGKSTAGDALEAIWRIIIAPWPVEVAEAPAELVAPLTPDTPHDPYMFADVNRAALEQSAPPPPMWKVEDGKVSRVAEPEELKTAWEAGRDASAKLADHLENAEEAFIGDEIRALVYPGAVQGEQASPPSAESPAQKKEPR